MNGLFYFLMQGYYGNWIARFVTKTLFMSLYFVFHWSIGKNRIVRKDVLGFRFHATGLRYQRQQIPNNYPTHPEAEVLVFDPIREGYIKEVHFYDDLALQTWLKDNPGTYSQKFYANRQYFKARCDYKAWQTYNVNPQ